MKSTHKAVICTIFGAAILMVSFSARAQSDDDKKFLAKAAQSNLNEIKLSQLAEQKATDPAIKAFAHKMVVEHHKIGNSLKPFLEAWNVTPATNLDDDGQKAYDKLSGLSGADFDKEYIDRMVSDHATALDDFTSEAKDTKDAKFRSVVLRDKTMIAAHKNMAYDLKKKL
jgi:putative membrane protein